MTHIIDSYVGSQFGQALGTPPPCPAPPKGVPMLAVVLPVAAAALGEADALAPASPVLPVSLAAPPVS